jgi:hypothetical protein
VVIEPTSDGTAHLHAFDLAPDRATAAAAHINALARQLHAGNDNRTMDQIRADIVSDLLTGNPTYRGGGAVTITVDLTTLTELADHPGELAGYGPVIADIARTITIDNSDQPWTYTVAHPDSGQPIATGSSGVARHCTTPPHHHTPPHLHLPRLPPPRHDV